MKKILIVCLCVISLQSFSQIDISKLIFSGGLGPAWIFGSESWSGPVLGVQVNAGAQVIELSDNSSINAGLGLSFQGSGWEWFDDFEQNVSYDGTTQLAYLNVPILFNYQADEGFYGEVGLRPGFLLSAKDKYNGISEDWSEYVNGFELGLMFGGGYLVNEQVAIGGSITYGVTNLYAGDDSDEADHNFIFAVIAKFFLDLD